MRRLHCVFQDGFILGIWMCPDERFYYHIAEADATEPLTKEEIWEMLDYAVAFHKADKGSKTRFRAERLQLYSILIHCCLGEIH